MSEIQTTAKKELSEPLRKLIRLLAKIAVEEYLEEERQKAAQDAQKT